QKPPVPVVYAFMPSTDPTDCSIVPDETDGARRAVTHLLDMGRHNLALVAGPERHHSARARAEGAITALATDSLTPALEPLYGEWSEAWGRQAARILLRRNPDIDAVFCASDQIARGLTDGLREAGKSVPGDIAITGFDNWDVMTSAARPALTSIDMDLEGLGRDAANLLLAAIGGEPQHGVHLHPCRLAIRASTAPDEG
ncbi:substrate-binding domain-containing protein, partial [Actinospica durhamensis]